MERISETAEGVDSPLTAGELRLVRQAVLMVSEYGTPRVVVAGLRFGELILEQSEHLAEEAGVRLVPLPAANGHLDIAVERNHR